VRATALCDRVRGSRGVAVCGSQAPHAGQLPPPGTRSLLHRGVSHSLQDQVYIASFCGRDAEADQSAAASANRGPERARRLAPRQPSWIGGPVDPQSRTVRRKGSLTGVWPRWIHPYPARARPYPGSVNWSLRAGEPGDAEHVMTVMVEAFETYRPIAPEGWDPPDPRRDLERVRERPASPGFWCLLAGMDGEPVGHVAFMPASRHSHWASDDATLAHLWQLFFRPPLWGSGLATALHAEAVREARGARSPRCACSRPPPRRGPAASTSARVGRRRERPSTTTTSAWRSSSTAERSATACDRTAPAAAASRARPGDAPPAVQAPVAAATRT
jgi:predicted N-acetyltransferase YhbS